jgi:hypothetical protein
MLPRPDEGDQVELAISPEAMPEAYLPADRPLLP